MNIYIEIYDAKGKKNSPVSSWLVDDAFNFVLNVVSATWNH